jgi:PD-(D/E)XK nuclease superfamily
LVKKQFPRDRLFKDEANRGGDLRADDGSLTFLNLAAFLREASPLWPQKADLFTSVPPQDIGRLASVLDILSQPLRRARFEGTTLIPSVIADLERSEVRITAFLAKLWSPSLGGEVATIFLNEFLRRIAVKAKVSMPTLEELSQGYSIACEQCPLGDQQDRLDMVIEGRDFIIAIEVKIGTIEGRDQLNRYVTSVRRRADGLGKRCHLVFLSPFKPSISSFPHAEWTDIVLAARTVLPALRSNWSVQHNFIHAFGNHVKEFL